MYWLKRLKSRINFKEPLSRHTTLGVGGRVKVWIEPKNIAELKVVICHCARGQIPFMVIGKGSNLLFHDQGFKGVAIALRAPEFTELKIKGSRAYCGAGVAVAALMRQAQKQGLGGLEFLAGIPATVAGAIVMNAGTPLKGIGDLVESVQVMDKKGRLKILLKNKLHFRYRYSNLERYIIVGVVLRLLKKDPGVIQEEISAFLKKKRHAQDLQTKSAGCIFKNPHHTLSAGAMIESCGLKGMRKGGAEISSIHANYIINRDQAQAEDILSLIRMAQREVRKKFKVSLEPEIKIIGRRGVQTGKGDKK
ncbi:MAG: UDP-N-acetylmuramate dehydrogenase [Candidatus Omnitrophota bacterium]